MGNKFTNSIGQNLMRPTNTWTGWFVMNTIFMKKNAFLEKNAVHLLKIGPNHKVLELGFGPGVGLNYACKCVEDGHGEIHGIDISPYMMKQAERRLRREIHSGKLTIRLGSVMDLPYSNDTFDRVFHVNCYYFWPNMMMSCAEIYRVMKPNTTMICTLNWQSIKAAVEKGILKNFKTDMINYMHCLEAVGFKNVNIQYLKDSENGQDYEAIIAQVHDKSVLTDKEIAFEESELEHLRQEIKLKEELKKSKVQRKGPNEIIEKSKL